MIIASALATVYAVFYLVHVVRAKKKESMIGAFLLAAFGCAVTMLAILF